MNTPRDTQLDDIQRERLGALGPKWDVFIKPLPHSSGIYDEEEADEVEVLDDSKVTEVSRHNEADVHLNSTQHMPDLRRSRPDKI